MREGEEKQEARNIGKIEAVGLFPPGFPSQPCPDIFVRNDLEELSKGSSSFQIMYSVSQCLPETPLPKAIIEFRQFGFI